MPPVYTLPRAKACRNCATAKVKCEPEIGYTKCKRCTRNGLECLLREPSSRKRRQPDNAVQAEQKPNGPASQYPHLSSRPGTAIHPVVKANEFERSFGIYQKNMASYFPFVIIPQDPQSSDFIKEKPFVSLAITMLGCTHDLARQRVLTLQGREYIATHLVQRAEKTLDLLQGLLLWVHWYHFQFDLSYQRTAFMHLAMSLVVDLGLNKSPFTRSRLMKASDAANGFELKIDGIPDHTLDERRAFLGCLYLSSVYSFLGIA
ncbi:hypothetical protein K469DRAFT_373793 [Zopfia rhizophila CBS 207.26]|uniref:Zn(2)-C6 fungal-type domain-containing protein n=1 Tax=Zopfia rhizophila CBS 207.26 TaxID=1314779 RepID=A0A6A6ENP0_9PEZI|nr:hypothetical protein K469DRAFT_373793 [Zopfia rhizophila CBS 207.26]